MQRLLLFKNKKYFIYTFILFFTIWTLFYIYRTAIQPTPISTWTCKGKGRHRICEVKYFCVDQRHGPFIINSQETFPSINLINTGSSEDIWFRPKQLSSPPLYTNFINTSLFVYGLYSPYHFSHALYNGLMPLYSTMLEYGATVDSWTLRAATYDNGKPKENLNMLLPNKGGREIVLDKVDLQAPHQGLAASWLSPPMCFERAIIGTGNRCSLWYCEGQIPTEHYDAYRSFVMKEPYDKNKNKCAASVVVHHAMGEKTIGILNRRYTRHITNVPELIQALTKENYRVLSIDFDVEGCDLINTAHVVNDLDVLIAPFGNGLGAGLFMKSDAILISISARYYSEQWFKYPMTAIGRRIFDFSCHQASCEEYDEALAQKLLGVPLNETELQTFFMMRPDEVDTSYLLQTKLNSSSSSYEERWQRYLQYHKDVARRIDVERFIPYLKEIILRDYHQSSSSKDVPFPETCKTPNVCCDLDCEGPLERNVFGEQNAWKNKGYKYIKEAK